MVRREATRAEVDELDLAAGEALDDDVLGLDVAVDQVEAVDEFQRLQDLHEVGDGARRGRGERVGG